ncbi:MAG TPA: peptide chain release factor 2 [Anaerolineales bacterium]
MQDLIDRLKDSEEKTHHLLVRLDLPEKENQFQALQKQSEDPGLWQDPENAQRVMKKLSSLKEEVESWQTLRQRIADALELAQMGDESLRAELEPEVEAIQAEVGRREFNAMLSGPYDRGNALLSINAGAGGTDSQDWAEMLERMYLRWIENHGFKAEVLDLTEGEEAGIKSVTIAVSGPYAFGYLRSEKGVHRLVRLSPFDAAHRRHTSFAQVEVLPEVESDDEVQIGPNDLQIDVYRSSGAGGQNVQKNSTAVRITHLPTGLVVTCQNERSQTQNRENAMRVLRARLLEIKQREQEEQLAELRGEYTKAEWGSQIRSYVLHPYQMVKDHRTDFEVGNAQGVLNGDLDGLIEAYLRSGMGNGKS